MKRIVSLQSAVTKIVALTIFLSITSCQKETSDQTAKSTEYNNELANGGSATLQDQLAQVRRATAKFHDVNVALEAGYERGWVNGSGQRIITNCVAHPTAGAMGYHYFNAKLMDDLAVDVLQPEVLVYEPEPDGTLNLVAVEWIARGPNSNPAGLSEPPSVLGMEMHILVPAVGFYIMHAWIWKSNPAGMFADWNPNVTCL